MESLDAFARSKYSALVEKRQARSLVKTQRLGVHVLRRGKDLVSFSCNDYLGLSHHKKVLAAAQEGVLDGAGAGGSRLVTGNCQPYEDLEKKLATFKQTEAALVFGSGYLANLAVIPALVGKNDLIIIDEFAHACMFAASQMSGAKVVRVAHNNVYAFEKALASRRHEHQNCMVLTEGVFSMDGDQAPLSDLQKICEEQNAWLLVDDAHGFGVLGDGRGTGHEQNAHAPLQVGTFSKAAGGYGGYLCASDNIIRLLLSRARPLVYSTGLPPSVLKGNLAALEILNSDIDRCRRPLALAKQFTSSMGLPEAQSAVVPVVLGSEERALAAQAKLEEHGLLVSAIRPPTVPNGTARLRISFSAAHTDDDVELLLHGVKASIKGL
ncbi:MAG: 8-amino-7-oxononanoate synthase [Deltaproteobacteria bacterium]|nr:8-amino-7-oxononanoate synthase [Deltaproteobacteria bacterium]